MLGVLQDRLFSTPDPSLHSWLLPCIVGRMDLARDSKAYTRPAQILPQQSAPDYLCSLSAAFPAVSFLSVPGAVVS
jgi:hypothetical protein